MASNLNYKPVGFKPTFDYIFGLDVPVYKAMMDPEGFLEAFIKKVEESKFVHGGKRGCHKRIKIKRNKTELTFQCHCMTVIVYPPRADRDNSHLVVNISKRDYLGRRH